MIAKPRVAITNNMEFTWADKELNDATFFAT